MVMELDMIEKIIQKAGEIYTNSPKVRKKKIAKLLFPNIFIDNKKRLTIEVNPILSHLLRKDFRNPGIEGIEPPTRSFGDSRSTTELNP